MARFKNGDLILEDNRGVVTDDESIIPVRNLIINGEGIIWQRGQLQTPLTTSPVYGSADRWAFERGGSGDSYADDSGSSLTHFRKSIRMNSSDSNAKNLYAWQRIEGDNFLSLIGETVYVGAWVYVSVSENATIYIYSNSNGSRDVWASTENLGNTLVKQVDINITSGVWTYISTTFTVTSQCADGVALGIRFGQIDAAGSYYFTGVRMHRGSVEVPWSELRRAPKEELALCQRYYETGYQLGIGSSYNVNAYYGGRVTYNTEKRVTPTMTFSSPNIYISSSWITPNGALPSTTTKSFMMYGTHTGMTAFAAILQQYTWEADAEL